MLQCNIKKSLEKTLNDNSISKIDVQSITKNNSGKYQATLYYYWDKSTKTIDLDISIDEFKVKENIFEFETNSTKQIEFIGTSNGLTTYPSENPKIATVSADGLIKAISPGKTEIYVGNLSENYIDIIEIYVDYENHLKSNIKTNYEVNANYADDNIPDNIISEFTNKIIVYSDHLDWCLSYLDD